MNRSHLWPIVALVGFFTLLLGLFGWSRYVETHNYLDPSEAVAEIARQENTTPPPIQLPSLRFADPSRGSSSTAALTVVEFGDFNCLNCRLLEPELRRAMQAFPTQARLVWRDLPLNADQPDGLLPAIAGRCAQDQGKFWEMHDAMFATAKLDQKGVRAAATSINLNMTLFDDCVSNNRHAEEIKADVATERASGIRQTPTLFVGTYAIDGVIKAQELANLIAQVQAAGQKK